MSMKLLIMPGKIENVQLIQLLLEETMATFSSILVWRIHMDREAWQTSVHGVTKSRT